MKKLDDRFNNVKTQVLRNTMPMQWRGWSRHWQRLRREDGRLGVSNFQKKPLDLATMSVIIIIIKVYFSPTTENSEGLSRPGAQDGYSCEEGQKV